MRTTLDIDDDLMAAAKELARREHKSAGKVVSELMRRALTGYGQTAHDQPATVLAEQAAAYGLRPVAARGQVVTNEVINKMREELGI